MNDDFRLKFAELAAGYVEQQVPYRHRGISRRGCDCTGLIISIVKEMGYLADYKLRQYSTQWNLHKKSAGSFIIEELEKYCVPIPRHQAGIGDIVVMWFGKCPSHCGIIIDKELLFVLMSKANKVAKKSILKNSIWYSRWVATYRIADV